MQMRRTNPFRIGLFTVLTHIHSEVFSLFRHSERKTNASQDCCDQERSKRRQPIGHQNGLNLATDQGQPAVVSKNLTCRVTGDQFSTRKDTCENRADCATNTMDSKGVEGIIKSQ